MNFVRQYLLALQCFTRVPVNGALAQWAGLDPDPRAGGGDTGDTRASAAHFPGVGLLIGLLACTVFAVLGLVLPDSPFAPLVAAGGCLAATVMLTGGVHEIGLAHVADALGSPVQRERALETTKDARLGSHGTLFLFLTLLAKVSLLAVLAEQSPAAVLVALLAAHVVSRFWPLLLMRSLPFIGDAGASRSNRVGGRIDSVSLAIAVAWCVVPLAIALFAQGPAFVIMGVLLGGLASLWLRWLFLRRLRGFSGDCVGATQQVCEIAFYLGAAIGFGVG